MRSGNLRLIEKRYPHRASFVPYKGRRNARKGPDRTTAFDAASVASGGQPLLNTVLADLDRELQRRRAHTSRRFADDCNIALRSSCSSAAARQSRAATGNMGHLPPVSKGVAPGGCDTVAPASRSQRALAKVHSRTLADGTPAMSFTRLLAHLATIVRNTLRPKSTRPGEATFTLTTRPTPKRQQALDLIAAITV